MDELEPEADIISRAEAITFLGLDEGIFKYYFQSADEFHAQERLNGRGRIRFRRSELATWQAGYRSRIVSLTQADYALCLDFALAQHYRGYVAGDFGTGRQREFGQKITNWVKGQLGELAVKKYLQDNFGINVQLDFEIHDDYVAQDIIGINEGETIRVPRIGVGIKSSKPKGAYLVLGENEITIPERRSDVYIYCRVDVPDDHLLRIARERFIEIVRGQPYLTSYQENIPGFSDIPCEIAGFCGYDELERVSEIPGQTFDGFRYVRKSGLLKRDRTEWQALVERL